MARELVELRNPYNTTFLLDSGQRHFVTVLGTQLHLADKTPVDCAVRPSAGVWTVGANDWDYTLGRPDDKPEDGWTSFGVGQDCIRFRLAGIGYLHWPTRTWQRIVDAPTYDRAKLRSINRPLILGPQGAEAELYPVGLAEWTGLWNIAGDNVWMRQRVEGRILKEEVGLSQRARVWIATNARPTTPATETFFGLIYELDPHKVYRWYQAGHALDIDAGFDDLAGMVELRTVTNDLLARMPQSSAHVDVADPSIADTNVPLRKRIWRDPTTGRFFLALGARVDELARLPEGTLVFDPTYETQPDAAAGKDTYVDGDSPTSTNATAADLYLGHLTGDPLDWTDRHVFVRFDLATVEGVEHTAATYYFYNAVADWTNRGNQYAYRILPANNAWIEACSWNYAVPSSVRWAGDSGSDGGPDAGCSQSGTDFDATMLGTVNCGNSDEAVGKEWSIPWDLTEFGEMVSANHGFIQYSSATGLAMCSSDHATAAYRPKLVVDYAVGGGVIMPIFSLAGIHSVIVR